MNSTTVKRKQLQLLTILEDDEELIDFAIQIVLGQLLLKKAEKTSGRSFGKHFA